MRPSAICSAYLGSDRLRAIVEKLSSPQIKAVLKEGGLKVKLPSGVVTQKKRRALWTERILGAVAAESDETASELLQQWLLNHERPLLIDYLEALGVKHRAGETDDGFLFSVPAETLREKGAELFDRHDRGTVAAYLDYIAFQQKSNVYDDWAPLAAARIDGGGTKKAPATIEALAQARATDANKGEATA